MKFSSVYTGKEAIKHAFLEKSEMSLQHVLGVWQFPFNKKVINKTKVKLKTTKIGQL